MLPGEAHTDIPTSIVNPWQEALPIEPSKLTPQERAVKAGIPRESPSANGSREGLQV